MGNAACAHIHRFPRWIHTAGPLASKPCFSHVQTCARIPTSLTMAKICHIIHLLYAVNIYVDYCIDEWFRRLSDCLVCDTSSYNGSSLVGF